MGTAKDPYKLVAELRDAALKREKLSKIDYNASIHKTNPFVLGDEAAIAAFVQSHDEETCKVFQLERLPVRCFWSPKFSADGPNRTTLSQAVEQDREVGLLLLAATKVEQALIDGEAAATRAAIETAQTRIKQLQTTSR